MTEDEQLLAQPCGGGGCIKNEMDSRRVAKGDYKEENIECKSDDKGSIITHVGIEVSHPCFWAFAHYHPA